MKRPLLHRFCSFWLALLVLTSSVGLTVQQRTCRQSGRHTAGVAFSPARHGCPAPQPLAHHTNKAQFTKPCCEFGAHFHKLDAPSAQLNWVHAPLPALLPGWPTAPAWRAMPAAQVAAPAAWHAADSSPPLRAGRTLLTFVGVLVV
ncbi:hypothetical protein [Hymenobacter swuensis]|uniref:Secreted protein n=1 Tax=Hymenobacter swuensis DY53 TaxID=1227739 RepID=W8F4R1_9BACT|nr:hypothetical protein [Hymenobacter swuensis]AHJ96760.1 hypothetical protein Hsw_1165 [Hymenobacter swuensis DY53]